MPIVSRLRRYAGFVGLVIGLISLGHFVARLAGSSAGLPSMDLNTALLVALAGISLALQARDRAPRAARIFALAGLVVGLLALGEFLGGAASYLETLAGRVSHPSLPATVVGLCVSVALMLPRTGAGLDRFAPSWIALFIVGVAGSALLASAFSLNGTPGAIGQGVGPAGAVIFLLLALGIMTIHPEEKALRILTAASGAGVLARRLLFIVLVQPTLLCIVLVYLLKHGIVTPAEGLAIFAITGILSGLALVLLSAGTAIRLEARREAAEHELSRLNLRLQEQAARLQETVAVRTTELSDANLGLRTVVEANARLALVASTTTNGVVITDAAGRIEWVNAAHERVTGSSLAELKSRHIADALASPDSDPIALGVIRAAIAHGERSSVEVLSRARDDRSVWQLVNLEPVRDREARIINFIAIETDLTSQHLAQQRLQALNQRLELATRSAALGVWEWDPASGRLTGDDRACIIHGVEPGSFVGTSDAWLAAVHPEDRARCADALLVDRPEFVQSEFSYRLIHPSTGSTRHIEARSVWQRDQQGRLERITGTVQDVTARHEATIQLTLLNQRLQLALRSTNFGVWEYDLMSDRLIWDERMFAIYGVDRTTFNGDRTIWINRIHPDDRRNAQELIRSVVSQQVPNYDTTFRIFTPEGNLRYIEAHGYLHRDEEGRPIRMVGLNRDVTGERELQAALDVAEQRWQLALEGSNDAIWDWNLETGQVFHDTQWARMLGYQPDEVGTGLDGWRTLVHPDELPACEQAIRDHLDQRTAYYLHEYRMRAADGGWKWILDRGKVVTRTPEGRALRMVGTHSDITARKQLEQRLRQIEEIAAQVSRLAQIGGWELDLETSKLTWSAEVKRIHGLDDSFQPTLPGVLSFYPPEARATLEAALEKTMLAGTPFDLELPLDTPAGRRIWVRVIGDPEIRNSQILGVQGAIQDITARHESDEARRQLETQLFQAQKMETLGTLAGGIAHDFNNLLTGILGYNELAADSVPPENPAHACLIEARNAGMRARELVEQILTFGRQSSGEQHSPVDLTVVIDEARRFLRATLPASITIETDISPECPQVLADATQIHQVILNLGSNAAHAMRHAGGSLRISLQPSEIGPELSATLGGVSTGGYVRLSVADTGHGMDEATLRRVFDPFFTTKNTREGTGLGLAVVHGIVRAHHGAIDVQSQTGVGSTFHIYLPAASFEGIPPSDTGLSAAPRGRGEVVYVVDDEEIVGRCTQLTLESKGYQAVAFGSAEDCLARLTEHPNGCAALVTDQTMPGMQGTELAAAVRKLVPEMPIVIVSGYFSKISPHALDELGPIELLGKPYTPEELMYAIDRALRPNEARSEPATPVGSA